jgi:hypothetical protein
MMDDRGNSLLSKPVAIDSKEHQAVIQGTSWYARCKPNTENYNGGTSVKYWYADNSVSKEEEKYDVVSNNNFTIFEWIGSCIYSKG